LINGIVLALPLQSGDVVLPAKPGALPSGSALGCHAPAFQVENLQTSAAGKNAILPVNSFGFTGAMILEGSPPGGNSHGCNFYGTHPSLHEVSGLISICVIIFNLNGMKHA